MNTKVRGLFEKAEGQAERFASAFVRCHSTCRVVVSNGLEPRRYYYGSVINYRYSFSEGGDPWESMVVLWEDGAREISAANQRIDVWTDSCC